MRYKRNKFTLIEILLAIMIFSVVMGIITVSFLTAHNNYEKIQKNSKKIDLLLKMDRFTNMIFSQTVPFSWKLEDTEQEKSIFIGESDSVQLAYIFKPNTFEEGAIRFILLKLEEDNLIVYYSKGPIIPNNTEELENEILLKDIASISFNYANIDSEKEIVWLDDWDEENNQNIPLAIQLTVDWKNGESESWLNRTSGHSKFESLGKRKRVLNEME